MTTGLHKKLAYLAILAGGLAFGTASPANAAFTLSLSGGGVGTTQTITDNGAGDSSPLPGIISFAGSQGGFSVVFEIGSSNSATGTAPAQLTLNNFEMTGSAGTLVLTLTDTGFTAPGPGKVIVDTQAAITSNVPLGSSVVNQTYVNGTLVNQASVGLLPAGAANVMTNYTLGTNPYTLTSVYTITLTGGGTISSSGLSEVQATPEPGTLVMALTALPLLGFGRWIRRRNNV